MSIYKYQTLQIPLRPVVAGGPSARGTAVGGVVKLLHKASKALNGWAVSRRVNNEIEKRNSDIEAAMISFEEKFQECRPSTGVLLAIGLKEWAIPDPTGTRAKSFVYVHIAGAGNDAKSVLRKYANQAKLLPGVPRGWRPITQYVWVTRG